MRKKFKVSSPTIGSTQTRTTSVDVAQFVDDDAKTSKSNIW